jgi:putative transposase
LLTGDKEFLHRERSSPKLAKTNMAKTNMAKTNMAKTNMAKCVLDAGWSGLRNMSAHKAITRGGMCLQVNEAYASQTCAECASSAGPKGRAGLDERTWTCRDCAAVHNRDLNAARNILRMGLHTLVEGARARELEPRSPWVQTGSSQCAKAGFIAA